MLNPKIRKGAQSNYDNTCMLINKLTNLNESNKVHLYKFLKM